MQAVTTGCRAEYILLGNQNFTYPTVIDLFQYKWGLACLKSVDSGDFCSDVERTWNITSMVANNVATWPQQTKKTFYDISSGDWEPYTDENGTLADPYNYDIWPQAVDVETIQTRWLVSTTTPSGQHLVMIPILDGLRR